MKVIICGGGSGKQTERALRRLDEVINSGGGSPGRIGNVNEIEGTILKTPRPASGAGVFCIKFAFSAFGFIFRLFP